MFFSPFSIAITSLGEERANLSAFRTFVRFVLVWICRFPLPLGVWEGLRFVIVALPGLFSYLFFHMWRLFCSIFSSSLFILGPPESCASRLYGLSWVSSPIVLWSEYAVCICFRRLFLQNATHTHFRGMLRINKTFSISHILYSNDAMSQKKKMHVA